MKRKTLLLMLLMALFSGSAWAQFSGDGTESNPYLISSQSNWNTLASNVSNGTTYIGNYFKLTTDITVTTMVGSSSSYCFKGTFNGDGHTLTFNYTASNSSYTAPFRYLNGTTIKNLKIAGSITAGTYQFCGGLAGDCYGTNTIENCVYSGTITGRTSGSNSDGTHGGFISRIQGGTTTFRGCAFVGTLTGSYTTSCGGFVGWTEGNESAKVYFYDCIYKPNSNNMSTSDAATFSRGRSTNTTNINCYNCYYSTTFGTSQGQKLQYTITGDTDVTVALNGTTTYNVSKITGYNTNSNKAILLADLYGNFNGSIYSGSGNSVPLNLTASGLSNPQYSASAGSLSGSSNPYTLIMTSSNTVISATEGDSDCTEIGTGTGTTGYAPVYGNYKSSYAQMIYTASQLQNAGITQGSIIKIGFNSKSPNTYSRNPVIYMGTTLKSSFNSDTDFIDINSLTKVYDYSNNHSQWNITSGWNEFELDTPFEYDGQSNIVIAMYCSLASYYSSSEFYYTSTSDNQTIYARNDNTNADPYTYNNNWSNYSSRGRSTNLPNVRLCFEIAHPTEIATVDDWNAFCAAVNGGYDYSGETVTMTANVGPVNTMAGTVASKEPVNCFKGTFDGQGHTLTINVTNQQHFAAPFKCVDGATISDLHTAGSITGNETTDGKILAGIVGVSKGNTSIIGCRSTVNITSYFNNGDDVALAGLVASTKGTGTLTVEGCAFEGSMTASTTNANHSSGIVGYPYSNATINVRNTVFAPTSLTLTINDTDYSSTFARVANNATVNIVNCYYTQVLGVEQGKHRYTITGQSPATVTMSGTETDYGASGIKAYKNGDTQLLGLVYNGTVIAGNSETVNLSLGYTGSGGLSGYQASSGTLNGTATTGSNDAYTLAMPNENVTISAVSLIYEISNIADWNTFCAVVNGGHNYENETVVLTADVGSSANPVTTMVGTSAKVFKGTFDGQGYTLTVNYTSTDIRCGVFNTVNNASFKNLKLAGTMSVGHFPSGGLIGYVHNGCHITNCVNALEITATNSSAGDSGVGGFLGEADRNSQPSIYFEGCAFTGKFINTCNGWGGFVGRNRGYVSWSTSNSNIYLTNCVFAPAAIPSTTSDCATFARSDSYSSEANSHVHITNSYYTQSLGQVQGKERHTITKGDGVSSMAMYGTATTTYSLSGITAYKEGDTQLSGLAYGNGTIWTSNGENVKLNLTATSTGGVFYADNATITGNSNPYTLAMPNADVVVRYGIPTYPITATSNNTTMGSVSGGGDYEVNTTCTLTATANSGYWFVNWTKDGIAVSTDATYSFTVTEAGSYVANFDEEGVVTIGDGSATNNYLPSYSYYKQGLSQQLYTPAEIGGAGTITSIAIYNAGTSRTRKYDIYLVHTNKASFSSKTDWITVTADDKVYTGSETSITANAWTTFTLDKPFEFDGEHNLALIMDDNKGSYDSSPHMACRVFSSTSNCAIYIYDDNTNFNPLSPPTSGSNNNVLSVKNQLKLHIERNSCPTPTNLTYTALGSTYVTLTWTPGEEEEWEVKYYTSGSEDTPIATYSVTGQPTKTITGLTKNTVYYAKVRAVCDAETNSAWSDEIEFDPDDKSFENSDGNNLWDDPDNWTPYGVPTLVDDVIVNFDVTIPEGCQALANTVTINVDEEPTITIKDGGQLWHNNEEEGESPIKVTIKKTIDAYEGDDYLAEGNNKGFEIISFPIDGLYLEGEDVDGLIPVPEDTENDPYAFYAFVPYNTDGTNYLEWVHYGSGNFGDVIPYRGYLYSRRDGTEISVTGEVMSSGSPVTGLVSKLNNGERFDGWALMGNPFVCNAYVTANEGEMNFYKIGRTSEQQDYDEFVPFDNSTPIEPMGGVMVRFYEDMDGVVYSRELLTDNVMSGILNMVARKANSRSANSRLDRARLRFGTGRNLPKLQLNPNHTKVYIPEGAKDYAVYYTEGAGSVPVNFKAEENGRYTLDFSTENVSFNYLHLIDNMTGADVDLLETPYYTFSAKSTDYESRFKVVFATGEASNDDNFAFYSNGSWVVNNEGDATLQVIDVLGHVLSSERISGATTKAINAASGIYMLRLINGDNVKVQKVVVR